MSEDLSQVGIGEVRTDVVITEGVGPLSRADVQKVVSLVLEHVRQEQDRMKQREKDTGITNRIFPPAVR
jgi:hypothetical protein